MCLFAGCNVFLSCLLYHNPAASGRTLGSGAQSPSKQWLSLSMMGLQGMMVFFNFDLSYIYFWLLWVFVAAHRLSLVAVSGGILAVARGLSSLAACGSNPCPCITRQTHPLCHQASPRFWLFLRHICILWFSFCLEYILCGRQNELAYFKNSLPGYKYQW